MWTDANTTDTFNVSVGHSRKQVLKTNYIIMNIEHMSRSWS